MSQALAEGPHMTLTPVRPATHADSVRATAVADTLRHAIARYADAHAAEPVGRRDRWTEMRDGKPVFGPLSPIAAREACDAVEGRFLSRLFGWMVHANVLEGDDPAVVWGMSQEGMPHGGMAADHGPRS